LVNKTIQKQDSELNIKMHPQTCERVALSDITERLNTSKIKNLKSKSLVGSYKLNHLVQSEIRSYVFCKDKLHNDKRLDAFHPNQYIGKPKEFSKIQGSVWKVQDDLEINQNTKDNKVNKDNK